METAPLDGIRVLEVGNFMAAPFCAMQLADLGADIIKVEDPAGGDQVRHSAPFLEGESSNFVRLNRNKRSLALDLKNGEGQELFRRLAAEADVVVENLRPGAMKRLNLDYEVLAAVNPGLVYVAASGWGQDGPLAGLAGLDIMAQARSGLMSITGEAGGRPVKVGVPICDLVCALYGALAAVAALRERDRTGRGQLIDVSLYEAGVSLAVWEAGRYFGTGETPGPLGSAHQAGAPYQAIRAADGWFTLGATTARTWTALCHVLDVESLLADPRFATSSSRHEAREELLPVLEAATRERPIAHWLEALARAGVPCSPIQDYAQVFADEALTARGFLWDGVHPTLGSVRQLGSPMRFSATPTRRERAGPLLGEDSDAVLRELGYDDSAISGLRARGVVG
ncbi:MAG: CoA transferase [Candidatus Dormibacteraeota bacterium]|nr:CoA transferase [Candidatus Dormibacteraeota bacterium]